MNITNLKRLIAAAKPGSIARIIGIRLLARELRRYTDIRDQVIARITEADPTLHIIDRASHRSSYSCTENPTGWQASSYDGYLMCRGRHKPICLDGYYWEFSGVDPDVHDVTADELLTIARKLGVASESEIIESAETYAGLPDEAAEAVWGILHPAEYAALRKRHAVPLSLWALLLPERIDEQVDDIIPF